MAYDDDEGPGFLSVALLLGGLGVGAWFLYRTLTGQAQAAESLPTGVGPFLDPATGALVDATGAPIAPSSATSMTGPTGVDLSTAAIVDQGDPSQPEGIRNNNPGNIKWSPANAWEGQTGSDPSGFAVFSDPVYGLRAAFIVLKSYAGALGSGFNIANITTRWTSGDSPAKQTGWASAVEAVSGIPRGQAINPGDAGQMQALVGGIVAAENGAGYVGYYAGTIPQAWAMA